MDKTKKILILTSDKNLKDVLNFCFDGWGYEVFIKDSPVSSATTADIHSIKKVAPDVIVLDLHSARKENLSLCHLLKKDFTTSSIPIITLINKRQLREQLLSIKEGVDDYLIKPPDPLDLRVRIEIAFKRSQFSFSANSLTGLSGARILEEVLNARIKDQMNFSFAYVDVDNFKYYNDVYGYHKGDCVITQIAHLLYNTIKQFGNADDFISHIGGDDFAFITTHDKYQEVCQNFIFNFERIMPFHYSEDDRKQGFLLARDRTHKIKKVPLMAISLAVVNKYAHDDMHNSIQINERVSEIKHYLKGITGSKFMADRRDDKVSSPIPHLYSAKDNTLPSYKPLGQILVERNLISSEQLYDALKLHWKRGVLLGEMLVEFGLLSEDQLKEALAAQKSLSYLGKHQDATLLKS